MKCFAIVAIAALVFATVQAEENNIPLITRSCTFEQISNANECEQSCQQDQPNSINFDWDDSIPKCDCLFAGGSPATLCSGVDDDEEDNDVPTRGELRRQLNLNLDMQCSSQVDRAVTGTFYNCFVKTYEDNDDAEEDDAIKCTFNKCENEFYRFTRILSDCLPETSPNEFLSNIIFTNQERLSLKALCAVAESNKTVECHDLLVPLNRGAAIGFTQSECQAIVSGGKCLGTLQALFADIGSSIQQYAPLVAQQLVTNGENFDQFLDRLDTDCSTAGVEGIAAAADGTEPLASISSATQAISLTFAIVSAIVGILLA
eukprot:gene5349-7103_t